METSKLDMLLEKTKPLLVEAVAQTEEEKEGDGPHPSWAAVRVVSARFVNCAFRLATPHHR